MSESQIPKKIGRPPKAIGKRQSYAFRMNEPVRDLVAAAAEAAGRSMSEEIEFRVANSFETSRALAEAHESRSELKATIAAMERIEDLMWPSESDKVAAQVFSLCLRSAEAVLRGEWREDGAVIDVACGATRAVMSEFLRNKIDFLGQLGRSEAIEKARRNVTASVFELAKKKMPALEPLEPQKDPARWSGRARMDVIFRDKATGEVVDTVTGPEFDLNDADKVVSPSASELVAARDRHLARRDFIDVDTVLVHILKDEVSIWDMPPEPKGKKRRT